MQVTQLLRFLQNKDANSVDAAMLSDLQNRLQREKQEHALELRAMRDLRGALEVCLRVTTKRTRVMWWMLSITIACTRLANFRIP